MWSDKYKLSLNHNLLPLQPRTTTSSYLKTYAFISRSQQQQYQIRRHPKSKNGIVMFDEKEYMQKMYTNVFGDEGDRSMRQVWGKIRNVYPGSGNNSLAVFVSNDPIKTNRLILGQQGQQSLLNLAFQDLYPKKQPQSHICLSIVGVQTQNSLTDELDLQWLQKGQQLVQSTSPMKSMLEAKTKINLTKNKEEHSYRQNIMRSKIGSSSELEELCRRYKEMSQLVDLWAEGQGQGMYCQMGQLYILSEVDPNYPQNVIQNHIIFRVNQYYRNTSQLLLRLGMNLKKIDQNKPWDAHDSKIFKLISQCLCLNNPKISPQYHLFMQIGEYSTFKEEHFCLAPFSQYFPLQENVQLPVLDKREFFYTKHYQENQEVMKIILQLQDQLTQEQKQTIQTAIKNERKQGSIKMRLKTKSYHHDTMNSIQKKNPKRRLMTENSEYCQKVELDELVHKTSKFLKLPIVKKTTLQKVRTSPLRTKKSFTRLSKMKKTENPTDMSFDPSNLKAKKKRVFYQQQPHDLFFRARPQEIHEGQALEKQKQAQQKKSHFLKVKAWLDAVYGSKQNAKIKDYLNSIHRSTRFSKNYHSSFAKTKYKKVEKLNKHEEQYMEQYTMQEIEKNINKEGSLSLANKKSKYKPFEKIKPQIKEENSSK